MSIQTIIGEWLWQKWASKALLTALKAGLAALITYLASKGVSPDQLGAIASVVNPEAIVAGAGTVLFFVIDLVSSIAKHRK